VPITGDGALRVSGRIVDPSGSGYRKCWISLHDRNGDVVDRADVPPAFSETFVIEPAERDYHFTLGCDGTASIYKTGVFTVRGGKRFDNPIDLGTLVLARS
jgi:hypothetical protein